MRSEQLEPRRLLSGPGDANHDGVFDVKDIVQVLYAGRYETGSAATWEMGDWNGDGLFTRRDLVEALAAGTYLQPGPVDEAFAEYAGTWWGKWGVAGARFTMIVDGDGTVRYDSPSGCYLCRPSQITMVDDRALVLDWHMGSYEYIRRTDNLIVLAWSDRHNRDPFTTQPDGVAILERV